MTPLSEFALSLVFARRDAFAARLEGMAPAERWALVEAARQEPRWPHAAWLEQHRAEKAPDLSTAQYEALTASVKRRPGTQVYALIHIVHGNEALAFIDPSARVLVWFHLEWHRNLSCFYLEETVDVFLGGKGNLYWRLPDTELT